MESSNQFPQDLFEHFVKNYLPVTALGKLALCSRSLNSRVNKLSLTFWNESINHDFKNLHPYITVEWLKKIKDTTLARICYIAFDFLKIHEIEPKYFDDLPKNFDPLPSPVLCSWFNVCIDATPGEMSEKTLETIWNAIPIEDRQSFYEGASKFIFRNSTKFYNPGLFLGLDGFRDFFMNDTNLKRIKRETLLYYSRNNDHEMLKSMFAIAEGVLQFKQSFLNDCLIEACSSLNVNIETIKTLVTAGAKPSEIPVILHIIIQNWQVNDINDIVLFLLDHGADANGLNNDQETPLELIADSRRPLNQDYVHRLLKENEDPEILSNLCLRRLKLHASMEVFTILQQLGLYTPGIKLNGETALHIAYRFHFISDSRDGVALELLRALLEAGEDPNALNDENETPLASQIGCFQKDEEILSL